MKTLTLFFVVCYAQNCIAQERLEYANFVQTDTAVKWAAIYSSYVNFTPVNPNFSLLLFYQKKLKANNVISYKEDEESFSVIPTKSNYVEFIHSSHKVDYDALKMNWKFFNDAEDDISDYKAPPIEKQCDTCFTPDFFFFKVKQLFFYKDHRFQIRNILLSPVIYSNYSQVSETLHFFETLNFAFDPANSEEDSIPASAKFIKRSCNKIDIYPYIGYTGESRILTTNHWNLTSILYSDAKRKMIRVYDTQKSLYPAGAKILNSQKMDYYLNPPVDVLEYDAGAPGITKHHLIRNEINLDSIHHFLLVQDFYFDFNKEKLYSKLIALVSTRRLITQMGVDLGMENYWGYIFPQEKKSSIKKRK